MIMDIINRRFKEESRLLITCKHIIFNITHIAYGSMSYLPMESPEESLPFQERVFSMSFKETTCQAFSVSNKYLTNNG
jgi:hypothetical protein